MLISSNNFYYNKIGFQTGGDENTISNYFFSDNNYGILELDTSKENKFENNELTESISYGIFIDGSKDTVIKGNNIHNNSLYGLYLDNSQEILVHQNVFDNNSGDALVLISETGNSTVYDNTFKSNEKSPISVEDSYYNFLL